MKKISKVLVLCLLVVSILSTCCVGVSANEIAKYELNNGVNLIVSNESLNTSLIGPRVVDTSFNVNLPAYPDSTQVATNLALSGGETRLEMSFTRIPTGYLYISLYDLTAGRYITSGDVDYLYGPVTIGNVFTFTGLTSGHKYRIRMSNFPNAGTIAGTITSY
jgi:hypothetical protein